MITQININALYLVLRHSLGLILGDWNSFLFDLRVEYNLRMGTIKKKNSTKIPVTK